MPIGTIERWACGYDPLGFRQGVCAMPVTTSDKFWLDIVLYRQDDVWVAHCVQLDILAADQDGNKAFEDAKMLCEAQLVYALEHDSEAELLFRPPTPNLMQMWSHAVREGTLQVALKTRVDRQPEMMVNRLAATAA